MREVIVACGGAPVPRPKGEHQPLVLDVGLRSGRSRWVTLSLAEVTRRVMANIPGRLSDLLEIACYVHAADQLSSRDPPTMPRFGEDWCRSFAFQIAVRDPGFWNGAEINRALAETLGFLSGDTFRFEFTPAPPREQEQSFLSLSGSGPSGEFRPEAVILFSGGLDSFAGAVETLLARGRPAVLVSHHTSHLIHRVQADLAQALRDRAGADRLLHVSVNPDRSGEEAVEFTQRTRSFLFATMGLIVARIFGRREITFFENGVVSLNLPLAGHVLNTRATRTTHPRTLHDIGALFSRVVAADMRLINPFFWHTKADIVRKIADAGCADLIPRTFSCAAVRGASFLGGRHCGVCSQCLDRRFGVLGAGCGRHEPAENYAVDLFRGARKPGADTMMAESYVMAAQRHARSTEAGFLGSYGEVLRAVPYLDVPPGEGVSRLHRLHVRHGQAVAEVVREVNAAADPLADRLDLPDSSLLSMICAPHAQDIDVSDPVEAEPPIEVQAAERKVSVLPRPLVFSVDQRQLRVTFADGPPLKGALADVIFALLPLYHAGLITGLGVEGFEYLKADEFAQKLRVNDHTMRQNVSRMRRTVAAQLVDQYGVAPDDDDIIQTSGRKGYRLNPFLSLISRPVFTAGGPERVDVTDPGRMSRTTAA